MIYPRQLIKIVFVGLLLVTSGYAGTWQGAWSSATTYAAGDAVSYKGGLYVSLQGSNINHAPPYAGTSGTANSSNSVYWSLTPSFTVFEVDNQSRTNYEVVVGRVFKKGDIANFPQPSIAGTPLANYQSDVKNRWDDGSVMFAIVSFIQTLGAQSTTLIDFVNNASGNNTGYLTAAQMASFNSPTGWGAQMVVTPGSTTGTNIGAVTVDFKAILAASDPATNGVFSDCKNDYWLQGPIVTAVIVQDCATVDGSGNYAGAYDFGWQWNGTNMQTVGTDPHNTVSNNGTSQYASLHPMAILYFFPGSKNVMAEEILESPWTGRAQDQKVSINYEAGATPTSVYSVDMSTTSAGYAVYGTRNRKVVWSMSNGTASFYGPGVIRTDPNFAYMSTTGLIGYWDMDPNGNSVGTSWFMNPDDASNAFSYKTNYSDWATQVFGHRCDLGDGPCLYSQDYTYGSNGEGGVLQREELEWMYNGASCGTANSRCSKAWQMLTGVSGAIDTGGGVTGGIHSYDIAGGAGIWFGFGNVPFYLRESYPNANTAPNFNQGQQVTASVFPNGNFFYVPKFDSATAKNADTCTDVTTCQNGTGIALVTAIGRVQSRHRASDVFLTMGPSPTHFFPVTTGSAALSAGGWSVADSAANADHWQNFYWLPYLVTGSPYYLESQYMAAAYVSSVYNSGRGGDMGNRSVAYPNGSGAMREVGYALEEYSRAARIAPNVAMDGATTNTLPEGRLFNAYFNRSMEVLAGARGDTTDPTAPPSPNTTCNCHGSTNDCRNTDSLNAWDWGHCIMMSNKNTNTITYASTLHNQSIGTQADPSVEAFLSTNAAGVWFQVGTAFTAGLLAMDMGLTNASGFYSSLGQSLIEKTQDLNYGPYLFQFENEPIYCGTAANFGSGSGISSCATYTDLKNAYIVSAQAINHFQTGNVSTGGTGNLPCGPHGYSLSYRAGAMGLQKYNVTTSDTNCSGGACLASTTEAWIIANHPYLNNVPADGSLTCGTDDAQARWLLAPQPTTTTSNSGFIQTPNTTRTAGTVMQ